MSKKIGILTTGGDTPGINAVIRAIGKAGQSNDIQITGFQDGFSGMASDHSIELEGNIFSGILTSGGTMLGTNRDLPDRMLIDGKIVDRSEDIIAVYKNHRLDGLICLGGTGAQDGAATLAKKGLNVITLPITIDNDVPRTDISVGFETAMEIAAEAIDRLHTTAISHHRIIIVEIMGRETGWLTLSAGIAGGADVILIPEIPYDFGKIAAAIEVRNQRGKRFSLVAVSEGAISLESVQFFESARRANERLRTGSTESEVAHTLDVIEKKAAGDTQHLSRQLEKLTGLDTRVTILGYLQRGGPPSSGDRVLATRLGTAAIEAVGRSGYGVMLAIQAGEIVPVSLEEVTEKIKTVPFDHAWLRAARMVGTCLGD